MSVEQEIVIPTGEVTPLVEQEESSRQFMSQVVGMLMDRLRSEPVEIAGQRFTQTMMRSLIGR